MIIKIHNWSEIVAAVICTSCLIYKPSILARWFILFLWTTVTVELIGKLTSGLPSIKFLMYNIFNGVEFVFYLMLLSRFSNSNFGKKIINGLNIIFFIFFFLNFIFLQGWDIYNSNTHLLGSIVLIISCLIQFYNISASNSNFAYPLKWPLICICAGLLFFYTGNFMNVSVLNYMTRNYPENVERLYRLINHSLNVILYLGFSVAFLLELRVNRDD